MKWKTYFKKPYKGKKGASPKQKAWRAFAEYVRLRDAPDGYGTCISCGKMVAYPNSHGGWHAGHYYPRSTTWNALYFDERNVNGQCRHCNTFLEGNTQGYREGLIRKYGEGVIEELEIAKRGDRKRDIEYDFEGLAKHYRKRVRDMKKERGIK